MPPPSRPRQRSAQRRRMAGPSWIDEFEHDEDDDQQSGEATHATHPEPMVRRTPDPISAGRGRRRLAEPG